MALAGTCPIDASGLLAHRLRAHSLGCNGYGPDRNDGHRAVQRDLYGASLQSGQWQFIPDRAGISHAGYAGNPWGIA